MLLQKFHPWLFSFSTTDLKQQYNGWGNQSYGLANGAGKTAAIKVYPLLYTGISGFVKTFVKSFFLRNREKIVYNGEKAVQTDKEKGEKNEIYFVECKWAPGLCAEGI